MEKIERKEKMKRMEKKKNFERLNLYLDLELAEAIKVHAKRDYLRKTTWVTQYLRKNLMGKNNDIINHNIDGNR